MLLTPEGDPYIPFLQTDFIYSAIAQELGLAGAAAVLLLYRPVVYRGFRIAMLADDGFSKLLAAGLTATLGVQAFIIVGGVTGLIPLTGITLPFVSYGGSSLVANFLALWLLLAVSNRVNARAAGCERADPQALPRSLPALRRASSRRPTYWLWRSPDLEARQGNPTLVVRQLTIKRGLIFASDGTNGARPQPERARSQGRTWYLRAYPHRRSRRPVVGYSTVDALAGRPREVDERLPHRIERQPLDRGRPHRSTSSRA